MDPITISDFQHTLRITRKEAAIRLGVSRQTLYNWIEWHDGAIPDPWCWKARSLMDGAQNGSQAVSG